MRRSPPSSRRHAGFTVVELVVVMTLLTVVAAIGMSKFADREPFAVQAVADQIGSSLRLAQASAQAQRRRVHIHLAASPPAMTVCLDTACATPLRTPSGELAWLQDTSGTRLAAASSFSFGPDGQPDLTANLALQVRGESGLGGMATVTVEAGSGHVH